MRIASDGSAFWPGCTPLLRLCLLPGGSHGYKRNRFHFSHRLKRAAFVLGISSRTLANWRCKGRGPAYIRLGKKRSPVMYRPSDVQDWIVEHQVKASGDARR